MALIVVRKHVATTLTSITPSKVFERLDKELNLARKYMKLLSEKGLWEIATGTKV